MANSQRLVVPCLMIGLAVSVLSGCEECRPGCEGTWRVTCESTLRGEQPESLNCEATGQTCAMVGPSPVCVDGQSCVPGSEPTEYCDGRAIRVVSCSPDGSFSAGLIPCGESRHCAEIDGTAQCVDGVIDGCSPAGAAVPLGCSEGAQWLETGECLETGSLGLPTTHECLGGQLCIEASGTADCVLTPLQACDVVGARLGGHCDGDDVTMARICSQTGYESEVTLVCGVDQRCVGNEVDADCAVIPLEPCSGAGDTESSCENNVATTRVCNTVGYASYVARDDCGSGSCTITEEGYAICS